MSCSSCKENVENALLDSESIENVEVNLEMDEVEIEFITHLSLKELQALITRAGLHYTITTVDGSAASEIKSQLVQGNGIFYCPMHCEDEKTYDQLGDCPVCGMDLVEQPKVIVDSEFTCPMHPEIIKDAPGDCPICGMDLVQKKPDVDQEKSAYFKLARKMRVALIFTIPVFLITMLDMLPSKPISSIIHQQYLDIIQLLLSLPVVFYATWMFFQRAWKSIISWNLNMFTLIGIGAGAAFMFSLVAMLFPDIFPDQFKTGSGTVFVYFEAVVVILSLVLLGQLLEARAHSKTSGAVKELLKLAPTNAYLITENGDEHLISMNAIKRGDHLRVKPGDKIPVDGKIISGNGIINESMITGEPIPAEKAEGDMVTSGTINENLSFIMVAEKIGSETLLSSIVKMVNSASRSKAPIQKMADRISKYFVPVVVLVSIITFGFWAIFGPEPAFVFAFVNSIAVLIIACPCALGLATPMSVMVGIGKGAQNGVLIKNAEVLEKFKHVSVLITDKTGTITEGKPSMEKIVLISGKDELKILQLIASLNRQSEHPLAQAVVQYGKIKKVQQEEVSDFKTMVGKGVVGAIGNTSVALGNDKLMHEIGATFPISIEELAVVEQKLGKTVSFIAIDQIVIGFVCITDRIKRSSIQAITELMQGGIEVVMLTGDNENTAKVVAEQLGLSNFKAECFPEDKLKIIEEYQSAGKTVAMAGDGINDAPALAQSDIGIAMGTGTDVAIESSQITLIKGDLMGIVKARNLSVSVMKNIKQNLFFAFFYNVVGIPIAAGLLYPLFGIFLSPMIAAAAMSFSSVSVIANSLRLRSAKLI